jgi:bifunctional DNA-binding transcriptional regulator/antitoxin component of YhaV-PrlF toxin-antitoxin module/nucleoid-associated protein YgaU
LKKRYLLLLVAIMLPASVVVGVATAAHAADNMSQSASKQLSANGNLPANHLSSTDGRLARGRGARTGQAALIGQQAVRVRPGDSLWAIASRTLRTNDAGLITRFWQRIYRKNRNLIGHDPSVLGVGQVLELPRAGVRAVTATQSIPPKVVTAGAPGGPSGGRAKVAVSDGDTLWSIAAWALGTNQNDVVADYSQLMHRANRGKIGPDANLIYPGQVLELPRSVTSGAGRNLHLAASLVTPQQNADSAKDEKQHDAKAAGGQDQRERSRERQLKSPQAGSSRGNKDPGGSAFDVLHDRINRLLLAAVFAASFLLLMMVALRLLSRRPSDRSSTGGASPLVRQPDEGQVMVTGKGAGGAGSAEGDETSVPATEGALESVRHLLEVEMTSFERSRQTEEDPAELEPAGHSQSVRKVDNLGRIVLPIEVRRRIGALNAGTELEIWYEGKDKIILINPERSVSGSHPPPPSDVDVRRLIRDQPPPSKLDTGHENGLPTEAELKRAEREDEPEGEPWWRFLCQEEWR